LSAFKAFDRKGRKEIPQSSQKNGERSGTATTNVNHSREPRPEEGQNKCGAGPATPRRIVS
jgi:hypothetical protein